MPEAVYRRFAVVEHDWPERHWDFFLEEEDHLRSWRLKIHPLGERPIAAEPTSPHRKEYLDYEGPVSGNRGRVIAVDRGFYSILEFGEGKCAIRLKGEFLNGDFEFRQSGETIYFCELEKQHL